MRAPCMAATDRDAIGTLEFNKTNWPYESRFVFSGFSLMDGGIVEMPAFLVLHPYIPSSLQTRDGHALSRASQGCPGFARRPRRGGRA